MLTDGWREHFDQKGVCVKKKKKKSGSFVSLGSNRSLADRLDATVEVVLATSHNCPPKLRPDLYNKGYATIIYNFGTLGQLPATMVSNGAK